MTASLVERIVMLAIGLVAIASGAWMLLSGHQLASQDGTSNRASFRRARVAGVQLTLLGGGLLTMGVTFGNGGGMAVGIGLVVASAGIGYSTIVKNGWSGVLGRRRMPLVVLWLIATAVALVVGAVTVSGIPPKP
jgi:hypothetical protein